MVHLSGAYSSIIIIISYCNTTNGFETILMPMHNGCISFLLLSTTNYHDIDIASKLSPYFVYNYNGIYKFPAQHTQ